MLCLRSSQNLLFPMHPLFPVANSTTRFRTLYQLEWDCLVICVAGREALVRFSPLTWLMHLCRQVRSERIKRKGQWEVEQQVMIKMLADDLEGIVVDTIQELYVQAVRSVHEKVELRISGLETELARERHATKTSSAMLRKQLEEQELREAYMEARAPGAHASLRPSPHAWCRNGLKLLISTMYFTIRLHNRTNSERLCSAQLARLRGGFAGTGFAPHPPHPRRVQSMGDAQASVVGQAFALLRTNHTCDTGR